MAKPLADRIRAALGPKSRLADVRAVLAETEAELERLAGTQAAAHRRRIDPATSHDEAEAANREAQDCQWQVARMEAAVAGLKERIAAILADESYHKRREAFAAARKARDELATRLKDRVPAIFEELQALIDECRADQQRAGQVNQDRPNGEAALETAECVARGRRPGTTGANMAALIPLADLQLVNFFDGDYMPSRADLRRREASRQREEAQRQELARQREARRSGAEGAAERTREAARWKRVAIRSTGSAPIGGVENRDGLCGAPHNKFFVVEMDQRQIAKARGRGVTVEEWGRLTHATAEVHSMLVQRDVKAAAADLRRPREAEFTS